MADPAITGGKKIEFEDGITDGFERNCFLSHVRR
jgi:hypothetical protein